MKYYFLFLFVIFSAGMIGLGIQHICLKFRPPIVRKPVPSWLLVDHSKKVFAVVTEEVYLLIAELLRPEVSFPYSEEKVISLRLSGYRNFQEWR